MEYKVEGSNTSRHYTANNRKNAISTLHYEELSKGKVCATFEGFI